MNIAWMREKCRAHCDMLLLILAALALAGGVCFWQGKRILRVLTTRPVTFLYPQQEEPLADALAGAAAKFEKAHPRVRIVFKPAPEEELRARLFEKGGNFRRGEAAIIDSAWAAPLVQSGALASIDDAPLALTYFYLLFYNIDMIRNAGFAKPPKTRSEFLTMAKAVRGFGANPAGLGISTSGGNARFLCEDVYPWFYAGGVKLLAGGRPSVESREAEAAFAFLKTLREKRLATPVRRNKIDDFAAGKAAFMLAPAQAIKTLAARMKISDFDVTAVPAPDGYEGGLAVSAFSWRAAVPASSGPDARAFAAFLAGKPVRLTDTDGGARSLTEEETLYKAEEFGRHSEFVREFETVADNARLETAFNEGLDALFRQGLSAHDAAASIQSRWEEILGER